MRGAPQVGLSVAILRMRALAQSDQRSRSAIQNRRSKSVSKGRGRSRLRAATCWRRARLCGVLDYVECRSLPGSVRCFIQKRFPSFRLRYSKTTRSEYYANTCPRCNVLAGDFYLHSEPGGPFFPTTEAEAGRLKVEEIPIAGPIEVEASFGVGCGELILEHGHWLGAGASV